MVFEDERLIILPMLLVVAITGCISQTHNDSTNTITSNNTPVIAAPTQQNIKYQDNSNLNEFLTTHEHFTARITKVVDGDTVYAKTTDGSEYKIRLLGVDTPETYKENKPNEYKLLDGTYITDLDWLKKWGINAKEFAKKELDSKTVIIVFDNTAPKKGYYGRYLAYIILNNSGALKDFNKELLTNGYARVYVSKFDKLNEYQQAEYYAKSNYIGLWNWKNTGSSQNTISPSNTNTKLTITYIHADAEGNDNYNLNDEYIKIKNTGSSAIDMTGWSIQDEAGNTYHFPNGFIIQPGSEVIYSGSGTNTNSQLYWGAQHAIWNNNGDTIYIIDSTGRVILTQSYNN